MAEPSPSTTIMELNEDSLANCAEHLTLRDISNLAVTCKLLRRVAYSDSVWLRLLRDKWPKHMMSGFSQSSTMREAYLARHTAVQQFKFIDPLMADFYTSAKPFSHVLLQSSSIIFSQGSTIQTLKIDNFLNGEDSIFTLNDHKARITSMRLFPLEASSFRSDSQQSESVLATSSCDHTIRLWWKGSCQRCFRGHNGPVSILSDKLLGDGSSKVFASGGEDGTVRLWSLVTSGKRGQQALKATLYGHEKPVKLTSVAGHKASLLVTVANDSKIRVWDSTIGSSAARSSCCVGTTSVPGFPLQIKCYESLLYIAAGTSVLAIDLRTMKRAFTAASSQRELYSFDILPQKNLVCTGMECRALLWDTRKSQEQVKSDPVAELDGHDGPVALLHMDPYKIVTGGPHDVNAKVWDPETGAHVNSLSCCDPERSNTFCGCSRMAVDGSRIVTASTREEGLVRFRDFTHASCSMSSVEGELSSKFWRPDGSCSQSCVEGELSSRFWRSNSYSDTDNED